MHKTMMGISIVNMVLMAFIGDAGNMLVSLSFFMYSYHNWMKHDQNLL